MEAWEAFVTAQERTLGKETVDKWLRTLKVVGFDACNLYLEATHAFQLSWFEEHLRLKTKESLFNNNHRPIKVHLTLATEETLSPKERPSRDRRKEGELRSPIQFPRDPLEDWATMELFVPADANRLLLRFVKDLLNQTKVECNPLFIHGGSGLGKSHLLMALARALCEKNKKALYVKAETFTEHVVSAIRGGEMKAFRNAYRNADVLLVDDIHLFARKAATQEEFFHTFNALQTTGRQILLASPVAPPQLEDIEPRLISRFEWGLVLRLEKLSPEELKEMLQQRCRTQDFPLNEQVTSFLLEHFGGNQQSLLKALDTLILRDHLATSKRNLTLETAKDYLKSLLEEATKLILSPDQILIAVAKFYDIRKEDILGKAQTQEFSIPRQVAMYLCRTELKIPFMHIGRLFSRDHSTVMASVRQIQKAVDENAMEMRSALSEIQRLLN